MVSVEPGELRRMIRAAPAIRRRSLRRGLGWSLCDVPFGRQRTSISRATSLAFAFKHALRPSDARIFAWLQRERPAKTWQKNYRCPDVAVFLPGNPAEDRQTHWYGGPDFAVEIMSRHDRSREKFDFYFKVGVRELLLVDRRPWRLELYRRDKSQWNTVGHSAVDDASPSILAQRGAATRFSTGPGSDAPPDRGKSGQRQREVARLSR